MNALLPPGFAQIVGIGALCATAPHGAKCYLVEYETLEGAGAAEISAERMRALDLFEAFWKERLIRLPLQVH